VKVVLVQAKSRASLVYLSDHGAGELGRGKELETEALDFVESMGFMMDNLNLKRMGAADRASALAAIPIFQGGGSASPAASAGDEIPIVTRTRPKSTPEAMELDDTLALEDLESEFRREEIEISEVDSALDVLLGASPEGEKPALAIPTIVPESLPPVAEEKPERERDPRWRTIARLLASF
jgi:hypothetical protein